MSDQYGQRFQVIDIMKGGEDGWDIEVVAASDYDRLTAENKRLAESVAELTKASEHWLQDRNAVADHRDRLAAALRECVDSDLRHSECVTFPGNCSACIAIEHAEAALAGTAAHETLATAQRDNLEAGTADLGKSPESQSGYDSPKFVKSAGRPDWFLPSKPEDWPDDPSQYMCHCATCGKGFHGDKRRVVCRVCSPKGDVDTNSEHHQGDDK